MKRTALILGLGHIGASLAARLFEQGWAVWGWDKDALAERYCRTKKWIRKGTRQHRLPASIGICVVAVPECEARSIDVQRKLAALQPGTLVTDVFSSKGESFKALARACRERSLRFAFSHPLAGRESHGARSADSAIFDGATVILDHGASRADRQSLAAFWRSTGCEIHWMTVREHQRSMAKGSHLMHVVAYSICGSGERALSQTPSVLGVTRVARSSPEGWSRILVSNKIEVARAIRSLEHELAKVQGWISRGDQRRLGAYFTKARRNRLRWERA